MSAVKIMKDNYYEIINKSSLDVYVIIVLRNRKLHRAYLKPTSNQILWMKQ